MVLFIFLFILIPSLSFSFILKAMNRLSVGDQLIAANGVSLGGGDVSHEEALAAISMSFGSE